MAVSPKLKESGYSYMEAKIATPGEVLTASQYWVTKFKRGEIYTEFKLGKILAIAIYDIA